MESGRKDDALRDSENTAVSEKRRSRSGKVRMSGTSNVASRDIPSVTEPEAYDVSRFTAQTAATSRPSSATQEPGASQQRRSGRYRSKLLKNEASSSRFVGAGASFSSHDVAAPLFGDRGLESAPSSGRRQSISGRFRFYRDKVNKYDRNANQGARNPHEYFGDVEPSEEKPSGDYITEQVTPGAVMVSATDEEHQLGKGHLTSHGDSSSSLQRDASVPRGHGTHKEVLDTIYRGQQDEFENEPELRPWQNSEFVSSKERWCRGRTRLVAVALCVLLVVIATIIGIVVPSSSSSSRSSSDEASVDDSKSNSSPSGEEHYHPVDFTERRADAWEVVSSVSNIALLGLEGSPQSMAFDWIVMTDILSPISEGYAGAEANKLIQRYVLAVFYYATGGNSTWVVKRNWLDGETEECDWKFVSCDGEGQVIALDTGPSGNRLAGNLPGELSELTLLHTLNLGLNSIFHLPWELHRLTNLVTLSLNDNDLSGSIPSAIYEMTSLESLGLRDNGLIGTISPSISRLSKLTTLELSYNTLTGRFPAEALGSVLELGVRSNHLDGKMDEIMRKLPNSAQLWLDSNRFGGSIPTLIGNFQNLVSLFVDFNGLSSTIPTELGLVTNLDECSLSAAGLTGTIPSELGNLSNLEVLDLSANVFSGTFPREICYLRESENLVTLSVRCNMQCDCRTNLCDARGRPPRLRP